MSVSVCMCMFQILRKYHYKTVSLIITQWRVGESRHPLSDSNCCSEPVSYAVVEEDGTSGLVIEVFDNLDKVVLMLYFFMVAHKAACRTVSKAFLKSMKTW